MLVSFGVDLGECRLSWTSSRMVGTNDGFIWTGCSLSNNRFCLNEGGYFSPMLMRYGFGYKLKRLAMERFESSDHFYVVWIFRNSHIIALVEPRKKVIFKTSSLTLISRFLIGAQNVS